MEPELGRQYILDIFKYILLGVSLDEIHVVHSLAKPRLRPFFRKISTDAVSAVMDDRASDRVCFKLEKRRSTEMLTPGIARISRATCAMYFRVPAFSFRPQSTPCSGQQYKTHLPPPQRIVKVRRHRRNVAEGL